MSDGKKPDGSRGQLVVGVFSALVAAAGVGVSYWGLSHPNGSPQNNFQTTYNTITNSGNTVTTNGNNNAVTTGAGADHAAAPPSADSGALSGVFVPLHSLTQNGEVELASEHARRTAASESQIHILLRVTSSKGAWKIFAPAYLPGWSLTTESGKQCSIDWNLNGILVFSPTNYQDNIPQMQAVFPGTVQTSNIVANCNQRLQQSDKFYLTAQLYALPGSATPDSPNSRNPTILNFNSDAIPLE
jgi:hypothetical protein